jgi:hypothetical protein
MNYKRGVFAGIFIWVFVFLGTLAFYLLFGIEEGGLLTFFYYWYLAIIVALAAFFYFRGSQDKGFIEGLLSGILVVIVFIILDAVLTIPVLFDGKYSSFLLPEFLIEYFVTISIFVTLGLLKD